MIPGGLLRRRWARRLLGLDPPIPEGARNLAVLTALYLFTFALSTTFLNVFLFKDRLDFGVVGRYNIASFLVIVPAFAIGGWLSKKRSPLWPFQLGLVFHAILFLAVLLLGHESPRHATVLGVLSGLGIGFYFLGQHAMTFAAVPAGHRDRFFSLHTLWAAILRVFAPLLSGALITTFNRRPGENTGYYVLFAATLVIYVFLILKASEFRYRPTRERFRLGRALREHLGRPWRPLLLAYFFWGIRNGPFWFVIGLLVYRATVSEMTVGAYSAFGFVVAVATAWWVNRKAAAATRARSLMGASFLDFASVLILLFGIDRVSLLAFTVTYMVAVTWFLVPFSAYSFEFMERASRGRGREMENLTVREIPLNLGRIAGVLFFLAGWRAFGDAGLKVCLLVLGVGHVAVWYIFTHTMRGRLGHGSPRRSRELEEETA
jgi:YQGE family putative transporter